MKKTFFTSLLAVGIAATAASLSAELVLLSGKAPSGQALDSESVKAVLPGKRVAIGDKRVVIFVAKAGDAQDAFLKSHVGMTTSQFQNHWRRRFMTGGGSAPRSWRLKPTNAASAEETTAAAQELNAQARALNEAVDSLHELTGQSADRSSTPMATQQPAPPAAAATVGKPTVQPQLSRKPMRVGSRASAGAALFRPRGNRSQRSFIES